jgi:hypothetical protein
MRTGPKIVHEYIADRRKEVFTGSSAQPYFITTAKVANAKRRQDGHAVEIILHRFKSIEDTSLWFEREDLTSLRDMFTEILDDWK